MATYNFMRQCLETLRELEYYKKINETNKSKEVHHGQLAIKRAAVKKVKFIINWCRKKEV